MLSPNGPENTLGDNVLNKGLFYGTAEENAFRAKIIIGSKLQDATFLDLDMNYGSRNISTHRRNDSFAHGSFKRHDHEV
jgi:hypothetical protein